MEKEKRGIFSLEIRASFFFFFLSLWFFKDSVSVCFPLQGERGKAQGRKSLHLSLHLHLYLRKDGETNLRFLGFSANSRVSVLLFCLRKKEKNPSFPCGINPFERLVSTKVWIFLGKD